MLVVDFKALPDFRLKIFRTIDKYALDDVSLFLVLDGVETFRDLKGLGHVLIRARNCPLLLVTYLAPFLAKPTVAFLTGLLEVSDATKILPSLLTVGLLGPGISGSNQDRGRCHTEQIRGALATRLKEKLRIEHGFLAIGCCPQRTTRPTATSQFNESDQ